jgi:hypothetical protein
MNTKVNEKALNDDRFVIVHYYNIL